MVYSNLAMTSNFIGTISIYTWKEWPGFSAIFKKLNAVLKINVSNLMTPSLVALWDSQVKRI